MTDAKPWRCFVAVPLPADLHAKLAASAQAWRERADLADLRWTDPGGWHLTLAFLGATDPALVPDITRRMNAVAGANDAWQTQTGDVGGFPSAGRARVAWYGVADPDRRLGRLAGEVSRALGIEERGRFRAHVTLARVRRAPVDLRAWVAEASPPVGVLEVSRIELMRSHLGGGPARYETLAVAPLGARVSG